MNNLPGVENSGREISFQGWSFFLVLSYPHGKQRRRFLWDFFRFRVSTFRPWGGDSYGSSSGGARASEVEIFDYYRKWWCISVYIFTVLYIDSNVTNWCIPYIQLKLHIWYSFDPMTSDLRRILSSNTGWISSWSIATVDGWNLVITTCDVQKTFEQWDKRIMINKSCSDFSYQQQF